MTEGVVSAPTVPLDCTTRSHKTRLDGISRILSFPIDDRASQTAWILIFAFWWRLSLRISFKSHHKDDTYAPFCLTLRE